MSKFVEVCETNKFLPRVQSMMKGHGLLYSVRDIDKITYDGLEFQNDLKENEEDKYSYAIGLFFHHMMKSTILSKIKTMLKNVMSNGYVFAYIPHKHYIPTDSDPNHQIFGYIPQDILIGLKQIEEVMFEIVDFQTFPYQGSYGSHNPEKIEYAFQIIMKKANTVFSKKDLSDDKGQLVSLDD